MTEYTEKFLFLRTRLAVDLSDDVLLPLVESLDWRDNYLLFSAQQAGGGYTWKNGLVFRIGDERTCADIAGELSSELSAFDSWAIHNSENDFVEFPLGGPIGSYFNSAVPGSGPSAMLFLLEPEGCPIQEDLASRVRDRFPASAPVFHFRDGRILMTRAPDPFRIITNRIGNLADRYAGFAGCDRDGVSFERGRENPGIWREIGFSELRFASQPRKLNSGI
ncbi:MAG: hypothetical protein ACK4RV_18315 [Caulobacter sp.]